MAGSLAGLGGNAPSDQSPVPWIADQAGQSEPTGQAEQTRGPDLQLGDVAVRIQGSLEQAFESFLAWLNTNSDQALLAGAIALAVFFLLRLVKSFMAGLLQRIGKDGQRAWASLSARTLNATNSLFLVVLAVYLGLLSSASPLGFKLFAQNVLLILLILQVAFWLRAFLDGLVSRKVAHDFEHGGALASAGKILTWLINTVVFSLALLLLLDNVGVDITTLIAGLGIGGIAIGLAAQGIFRDLFSALTILFDSPFRRGDFIQFADFLGEVEEIGLRSTRIRALTGEQVIIGNTNLLDKEIQNYGRMYRRRVQFTLGLIYQTSVEQLEKASSIIETAVRQQENVRFDRAHFTGFGTSALEFEIVYFVNSGDYNAYMDSHERILLEIARRFEAEGLRFAYPTRTLYLADPEGQPVSVRELIRPAA